MVTLSCMSLLSCKGSGYLTRTKDLKSSSQTGVVLVVQVRPVCTISLALKTCGWVIDVMLF